MKKGDLVKGSHFDVMLVGVIKNEILHPEMEYCQASPEKHMFRDFSYEGRDFMSNNPDSCNAIIAAPEKHYKAQLVDGSWWWVNDCAQCCGHRRDWMGSECEKHNACRSCSIPRAEITETPWGGKEGWQCQPCGDAEQLAEKTKALQSVQDKINSGEYDEWDYVASDNIKCPHCDSEYGPCTSDGIPDGEETCETCGGIYSVVPEYSITYSTKIIGKRLTVDDVK